MDDSGSSVEASYILCRVDWQYGLLVDEEFGVVYRKDIILLRSFALWRK